MKKSSPRPSARPRQARASGPRQAAAPRGSRAEGGARPEGLAVGELALTQLALFVGMAADESVLRGLRAAGFAGLRPSHGYLVQRLLAGPSSISELARGLGVTQQAVSKSAAELARGGYLTDAESDDKRVRRVQLSERGWACVEASRGLRGAIEAGLREAVGERALEQAHRVLSEALTRLGGAEAVQRRRVRPPR